MDVIKDFETLDLLLKRVNKAAETDISAFYTNFLGFMVDVMQNGNDYEKFRQFSVPEMSGVFFLTKKDGKYVIVQIVFTNEPLSLVSVIKNCVAMKVMDRYIQIPYSILITNGVLKPDAYDLAERANATVYDCRKLPDLISNWIFRLKERKKDKRIGEWLEKFQTESVSNATGIKPQSDTTSGFAIGGKRLKPSVALGKKAEREKPSLDEILLDTSRSEISNLLDISIDIPIQ